MAYTPMTLDEQFAIGHKALALKEQGKMQEYKDVMIKELPMPPYLAKIVKEDYGAEYLIKLGCNLVEANAEFGLDWLTK
jgi:hypothetical protein